MAGCGRMCQLARGTGSCRCLHWLTLDDGLQASTPSRTIGHLPPFDDSGKQPSERLLHFRTCLKASAHNSAITDAGLCSLIGRQSAAYLPFSLLNG